ncbi:MAG: M14 family zinc carboxypeptidase, partial [Candidatus Cloacimonadota bacterium]|nr:M14 family zinc carboxypeptidase [Candidatus Cloacimonadota bacterium]
MNANDVDLNRHFPDYISDPNNNTYGREPEIASIMNFTFAHNFSLTMNFHTGALVINYPFDNTYSLAPDDELLQEIALSYSENNLPMYNNPDFTNGITNGAAWYLVHGSMQDWNYFYENSMAMTSEVSNVKWPPENELDGLWEDNQESLLSFIEMSQTSISGVVTNNSEQALLAEIEVNGNDKTIVTDSENGSFNRLLLPGTYTVTVSSYGHQTQTIEDIEVIEGERTIIDFELVETDLFTIAGQVRNTQYQPIEGAVVSVENVLLTSISDENGNFEIENIYEGINEINITKDGYSPLFEEIFINEENTDFDFTLFLPAYSENFTETDWESDWILESEWGGDNIENNTILSDSPAGEYQNNLDNSAVLIAPINLEISSYCNLSFDTKYNIEAGYDYCYFEVSTNQTDWTEIDSFSGAIDWTNKNYELDDYCGGNFYFRFRIVTDGYVTEDGIQIDNILVDSDNQVDNFDDTASLSSIKNVSNYPNPFNPTTTITFEMTSSNQNFTELFIYNIRGQLVRKIVANQLSDGKQSVVWNGTDENNDSVSSGVYFYKIDSQNTESRINKMLFLK